MRPINTLIEKHCVLYTIPHAVGAVKDLITGNVYSQATPAAQPTIVQGLNGLPAHYFDGGDSIDVPHDDKFNLTDFTCVTVHQVTNNGGHAISKRNVGDNYFQYWNAGYYTLGFITAAGVTKNVNGAPLVQQSTALSVVAHSFNNTTKDLKAFINGVLLKSANFPGETPGQNTNPINLGKYAAGGYAVGRIQNFLLFNTALTDEEHLALNNYLRRRIYLPDDAGTVFYGGTKAVDRWTDKSLDGDLVQATPANQPAIIAGGGWNGRDVFNFRSASNNSLCKDFTNAPLSVPFSITLVIKRHTSNDNDYFIEVYDTTNSRTIFYCKYDGIYLIVIQSRRGTTLATNGFYSKFTSNFTTITFHVDENYLLNYFVDGDFVFTSTMGPIEYLYETKLILGTTITAPSQTPDCLIQDCIVRNGSISATEIVSLHKHLRTRSE